jgi:hypothetical protein
MEAIDFGVMDLHACPMIGVDVFCTCKNRVIKIMHSSSEMVLRTINHIIIYPGSASN